MRQPATTYPCSGRSSTGIRTPGSCWKAACYGHEIPDFEHLLNIHPHARIVVNDQYSHSRALSRLGVLIGELAPCQPIDHITVTFTKDRLEDISTGRFVDRIYGVLGYEWLHMLAVVRQILPSNLVAGDLTADPARSDLYATYDERLFVSSLTERSTLGNEAQCVYLELASSITEPLIPLVAPPAPGGRWQRALRADNDRHRHVTVHAGVTPLRPSPGASHCPRWLATGSQPAPADR